MLKINRYNQPIHAFSLPPSLPLSLSFSPSPSLSLSLSLLLSHYGLFSCLNYYMDASRRNRLRHIVVSQLPPGAIVEDRYC